jgi:membrane protein YqaA with SNARE-associated domain
LVDAVGERVEQTAWVRWLAGAPGVALAFVWGLAEATFFFVVPDVGISLAAALAPRRAWRHVLAAIAGSVLGGALMFNWAASDVDGTRAAVMHVPFVRARMFLRVDASYAKHGMGAVYLGPLGGFPYKIYAVEAPQFVGRTEFLAGTVPARGYRFVLVWIVFGVAGQMLRRTFRRTDAQLVLWHGVFWILLYAVYWGEILLQ